MVKIDHDLSRPANLSLIGHAIGLQNISFPLQVPPDIRNRICEARTRSQDGKTCFDFILHPDLIVLNVIKNLRQKFLRKIFIGIDSTIVLDEVSFGHPLLDLWVICVCVEHDHRVGEDIGTFFYMSYE